MEKYECKKLKTLILQDGTNTVSKLQKNCIEILDDMFSLIEACKNKFQPDVFVVMEVIPFKETDYNRSKNKLIDEVNAALKERLESLGENYVLLKMNELIRSIPSFNPMINHYNFLYHDNVHLNYNHGILFLENHLLMFLLQTSISICDTDKFSNRSNKMINRFQKFQEQYWPKTMENTNFNLNNHYRYQPY